MNRLNLLNLTQPLTQIRLNTPHILEHSILFNRFERRSDRRHREHSAAKRRAEIILFDMRSDRVSNETRADRNTAAQRLRQRHDVRHDPISASKEPLARASDASLYFIVNQHDAALVTQRA